MQIKRFLTILFLFIGIYYSISGYSQRIITGQVLNLDSKLPVEDVAVSVFRGTTTASTNKRGHFQMTITEEDSLVFTHPDYKSGGLKPPEASVFIIYVEQYNYFPSYLDGEENLFLYLQENLKYPRKARIHEIEGLLYIEVVVDSEGEIVECKALNELGKKCEPEIIMVFEKIPGKWEKYEEPVKKSLIFPVEFRLASSKNRTIPQDYDLPRGKLMNKITVTAYASSSMIRVN